MLIFLKRGKCSCFKLVKSQKKDKIEDPQESLTHTDLNLSREAIIVENAVNEQHLGK